MSLPGRHVGVSSAQHERAFSDGITSLRNMNLSTLPHSSDSENYSLEPQEIIKLSSKINVQPVLFKKIGQAEITVFHCSSLYDSSWTDSALHLLVKEARKTYRRYGDVPLIDLFDEKSSIYISRATYPEQLDGEIKFVEEWLSMRFVPAFGEPTLTEDINFAVISKGKTRETLLARLLKTQNLTTQELSKRIVTHSRISAIRPYLVRDGTFLKRSDNGIGSHYLRRNRFTGLNFALMNVAFFQAAAKNGMQFGLITSLMHRQLTNEILTLGQKVTLPFVDASETLSLESEEKISLDQSDPLVRYNYPGYFLNIDDLMAVLKSGLLPPEVIKAYIQPTISLEEVFSFPKTHHFHKMNQLFLTTGPIPGTSITGEELRKVLDERVKDGPILRIMKAPKWIEGTNELLNNL